MMEDNINYDCEKLLFCLRKISHREKISSLADFTSEDWGCVLQQARRHNLAPALFWELNVLKPDFKIPEPTRIKLYELSLECTRKNIELYTELKLILQALHGHDIATIVLKGAYLAALVYPDISLRTIGDIDILVPREKLKDAGGVLEELGYQASRAYEFSSELQLKKHLPPYGKPNYHLIELHWRILNPDYPFSLDIDRLWQRAQPVKIANSETQVFAPEDLLLHLCIHAAYQHRLAFGLRAFYDIRVALEHYQEKIIWDQLFDEAQAWKAEKPLLVSLKVVKDFFNVAIPGESQFDGFLCNSEMYERVKYYACTLPERYSDPFVAYLETESFYDRIGYLIRRVFLTRDELAIEYGIPVGSRKIFFYFFVRAYELVKRYYDHFWQILMKDHEELVMVKQNLDLHHIKKWLEPDH